MSEYKKETAAMVSIAIIGVLALAVVASYLAPAPISLPISSSQTSSVGFTSTTTSLSPCDQNHPLTPMGVLYSVSAKGIFLYTKWTNCGTQSFRFLVSVSNIVINVTSNGRTMEYTDNASNFSGTVGEIQAMGTIQNLTVPLYPLNQVGPRAVYNWISGNLVAIDVTTGQTISPPAPSGPSGFSTVENFQA
jgi:hypothetical protein